MTIAGMVEAVGQAPAWAGVLAVAAVVALGFVVRFVSRVGAERLEVEEWQKRHRGR